MKYRALITLLFLCGVARADETVRIATYNVEHFQDHFFAFEQGKALSKERQAEPDIKEMLYQLRTANDKANWATAEVITNKDVNADILVIEEGCTQSNLEYFNKRWLHGAYATAVTFPTNTGARNQHLNMLLKPGFKILKQNDKYHEEKDTGANGRGDKLFARGPAFCLIQTPSGYKLWVGVTHQKSKRIDFDNEQIAEIRKANAGQPKAVIDEKIAAAKASAGKETAATRNREAARTHEIIKELSKSAEADDVILLGDMNDDLGMDEYEKLAGADAIALLVGPPEDGFLLVTKPLVEKKEISFGGYYRPDYRSFIDHIIATPTMKDQIVDVKVFQGGLAPVSSDHYPVVVTIRSDKGK